MCLVTQLAVPVFCLGFHAELCPLWLLPLFSVFVLAFPTSLRLLGSDALGM